MKILHYALIFLVALGLILLTGNVFVAAGVLLLLLIAEALLNQRRHQKELQQKLDEKRQKTENQE